MKKRYVLGTLSLLAVTLGLYWFFKNLDEDLENDDLDLGVNSPTKADLERIRRSRRDT